MLPQSWAVLSGAAAPARAEQAMQSVLDHLVDADLRLVRLLTPPFDKAALDPGYIKGYAPGVRENGGQYSHAAVWAAMAFAKLRRADRAWELLEMVNPIRRAETAAQAAAYRVEPTSSRRTFTPPPATRGAADGPGTPAPQAGRTSFWSGNCSG